MLACYVSRCAMYRWWSESVETCAMSSSCCLPHRAQWWLSAQTHSRMSSTINYQHRPQLHTTLYAATCSIFSLVAVLTQPNSTKIGMSVAVTNIINLTKFG